MVTPRLLVDAVAAYRLTRLITEDGITDGLRDELAHRVGQEAEPAEVWAFLHDVTACRWCTGLWVALGIVIVRRRRWWPPLADALAMGAAAGLIARLEE